MLKTLIKKQLAEINRTFFFNTKKNRMRTKGETIGYLIFYIFLMVGVLGGILALYSFLICEPLVEIGFDWLYFTLSGFVAILLAFVCSVFTIYGSVYMAKDNDLLLSLPIPARHIVISRLISVSLWDAIFSIIAFLPTIIVYIVFYGASLGTILGGIVAILVVFAAALLLSCIIGWFVAKIGSRMKSKTFVSVLSVLAFIVIYYVFYAKFVDYISEIASHAAELANTFGGMGSILYRFGDMCLGGGLSTLIYLVITIAFIALSIAVVTFSFNKIVTKTAPEKKVSKEFKTEKAMGSGKAFFMKEVGRLKSSSNYILNCGLGVFLMPGVGILALIKGRDLLDMGIGDDISLVIAIACCALMMLASMVDTAAPSVSLEGNTHWISQTLPANGFEMLKAKMNLDWVLKAVPALFCQICVIVVLKPDTTNLIILLLMPQAYFWLTSIVNTMMSVYNANYTWTNEIYPIKQSASVTIALFGGWAIAAVYIGLYLLLHIENFELYSIIWTVALLLAGRILLRKLATGGVTRYLKA